MSADTDVLTVLDDYLPAEECRAVLGELRFVLWRASQVVHADTEGALVSGASSERTSESTTEHWFRPPLRRRLAAIEERLVRDFGVVRSHLEPWQAVRYRPGGRFGLHTDGGLFGSEPAGERVLTFLLYLKAPRTGGGTYFPRLDRIVEPVAGRLVVWKNLLPDGAVDPRTLHAATPTREGRKVVLTTWSRERPARSSAAQPTGTSPEQHADLPPPTPEEHHDGNRGHHR